MNGKSNLDFKTDIPAAGKATRQPAEAAGPKQRMPKKSQRAAKTPAPQKGWPEHRRRSTQQPTMTKNPTNKNEKNSQRRKGKEIEKKSPEEPKHLRFKGVGPKSGEAPSSPR